MSIAVILTVPKLSDQLAIARSALEMGYHYMGVNSIDQLDTWETACRSINGLTGYPCTYAHKGLIMSCMTGRIQHYLPAGTKLLYTNSIPHFLSAARQLLADYRAAYPVRL